MSSILILTLHFPRAGGIQDYHYVRASCYDVSLELSCCRYPPTAELLDFWEANRDALINFLLIVHMGESRPAVLWHSFVAQLCGIVLRHSSDS